MSWSQSAYPPIFEDEDELELKLKYAKLIAFDRGMVEKAGYQVFPGEENRGRAMQARNWQHDHIVLDEIQRLLDDGGAAEMLPTPTEFKAFLWQKARSAHDPKMSKEWAELYAKTEGLIQTGTNVAIDNSVTNNKLVVPARPITEEEREVARMRTELRQQRLLEHARSGRTITVN